MLRWPTFTWVVFMCQTHRLVGFLPHIGNFTNFRFFSNLKMKHGNNVEHVLSNRSWLNSIHYTLYSIHRCSMVRNCALYYLQCTMHIQNNIHYTMLQSIYCVYYFVFRFGKKTIEGLIAKPTNKLKIDCFNFVL